MSSTTLLDPPCCSLSSPAYSPVPLPVQRDVRHEKTLAFESLLRQTGYRELAHVRVRLENGLLVLQGKVALYYLKQLAQEAVRPLAIGMRIRNELQVD